MKPPVLALACMVTSLIAASALAQEAAPPPPPAPAAQPAPPAPPAQPVPPAPPAAPMAPAEQAQPMAQQAPMPASSGSLTDVHSAQIGPSITVNSGMPEGENYGPKPAFAQLDADHNGRITQEEAKAYLPLYNDWIHVAGHGTSISKSQYAHWTD